MSRRKGGLYLPLDVNFWDDPRIVRAGEKAAVLYLAMALACKRLSSDGRLELVQIDRLHVQNWRTRLATLLHEELVLDLNDGYITISAWLQHNDPAHVVQARRQADAERKRGRTPNGIRPESAPTPSVERSREERREVPPPPESGTTCIHDSDSALCSICSRPQRGVA
jgi:hypothetical protein